MNFSFLVHNPFRDGRLVVLTAIAGLIVCLSAAPTAQAQRRGSVIGNKKPDAGKKSDTPKSSVPPAVAPGASPQAGAAKNKTDEVDKFAPQDLRLEVRGEGIEMAATWFPPIVEEGKTKKKKVAEKPGEPTEAEDPEPGKSTAAFILIHDWTRSRADMFALGQFLQSQGHAVIIPDLRGHGQSVRMRGSNKPLDHAKFKKNDIASAIADIDQCKRFLQEQNNEGVLNLDLLNVVAVGDSAHLAIAWAMADWSWEPVAGIKQGKDVKSLILFSPTSRFAGGSLKKMTKLPLISGRHSAPLPLLVIWGGQSEVAEGCEEFIEKLRKFRPEAPEGDGLAARWFKQDLFDFEAPTSMEGHQLAGNPSAKEIWAFANNFVSQKVLAFSDQFPWQIRGAAAILKAKEDEK